MIVLGIDSSAKTAGVAVLRDGTLLYESWLGTGFTHSETLLELTDAALRAVRITPAAVDVYAVTAGPGSFTGLRIGMALVKGLAAVNDTPCVPVSTLRALAAACDVPGLIIPAMDARRGEVYTAAFCKRADGTLLRLRDDTAESAAAAMDFAAAWCAENPGCSVTLVGDGAYLCAADWAKRGLDVPAVRLASEDLRTRAAAAAAHIAAEEAAAGQAMSAAELRPDYHRLCQAERERAEREAAAQAK